MLLQMTKAVESFGDSRDVSGRNPPQNLDRALDRFEPLLSVAKRTGVSASVDELLQRLERFPHGHVDRHAFVRKRPDRHGIAVVGLEPPHESRTAIGERVDRAQLRAETFHHRIVDRGAEAADVHLRQMETRHHLSFRAASDARARQYVPSGSRSARYLRMSGLVRSTVDVQARRSKSTTTSSHTQAISGPATRAKRTGSSGGELETM